MITKLQKSLLPLLLVLLAVLFIVDARHYMDVFVDGITVWAYNVLPALLPFALLTRLLTKQKKYHQQDANTTTPNNLFALNIQQRNTVFLSFLCGYPLGAKLCAQLPQLDKFERRQKNMLVAMCSTASPIFMIGTLGASFLQNTTATIIIVIAHYMSAIINGIINSAFECPKHTATNQTTTQNNTNDYMADSLLTVTCVGGYVAIFYVIADMFKQLFITTPLSGIVAILTALLEMTGGCYYLANNYSLLTATVLCSGLISFGGLCVAFQNMTFLSPNGYKLHRVLFVKAIQGALSSLIAFILAIILL